MVVALHFLGQAWPLLTTGNVCMRSIRSSPYSPQLCLLAEESEGSKGLNHCRSQTFWNRRASHGEKSMFHGDILVSTSRLCNTSHISQPDEITRVSGHPSSRTSLLGYTAVFLLFHHGLWLHGAGVGQWCQSSAGFSFGSLGHTFPWYCIGHFCNHSLGGRSRSAVCVGKCCTHFVEEEGKDKSGATTGEEIH